MTARDDIRAALARHPGGLNLRELAAHCPNVETREDLARAIAALRGAEFIRPIGLREGYPVYKIHEWPAAGAPATEEAAPAARATPAIPPIQEEAPMSSQEKILRAVADGPQKRAALAALVPDPGVLERTINDLVAAGDLVRLGAGRGTQYGLKGANGHGAAVAKKPNGKAHGKKNGAAHPGVPGPIAPKNAPAATPAEALLAADFAITATGTLSLTKDGAVMHLTPAEYARLRAFTERASAIWKGGQ